MNDYGNKSENLLVILRRGATTGALTLQETISGDKDDLPGRRAANRQIRHIERGRLMPTVLHPRKTPASFFGPRDDTAFAWLGMAGLLVNARGTVLMVDPAITLIDQDGEKRSEHGYALKIPFLPLESSEVVRVAAILHTHAEGDHFGRPQAVDP